jgi:hypothetical protein
VSKPSEGKKSRRHQTAAVRAGSATDLDNIGDGAIDVLIMNRGASPVQAKAGDSEEQETAHAKAGAAVALIVICCIHALRRG